VGFISLFVYLGAHARRDTTHFFRSHHSPKIDTHFIIYLFIYLLVFGIKHAAEGGIGLALGLRNITVVPENHVKTINNANFCAFHIHKPALQR
jgi:hypothetical protein